MNTTTKKVSAVPVINQQATTMKAIIATKYGSPHVLKLAEVQKPVPKDQEILLRIHATSATSGDARIRRADPFIIRLIFGFKKPRNPILGVVVAGEVVKVGKGVTKFKVGDRVFGANGMDFGAYAEYIAMPQNAVLALLPKNMNYEEAAAIPFGATAALHFLRKANIQGGQKILIYGASGALGTAAIQLAKTMGAEVTAVCSTTNIELVKSLGADHVIDYTQEDFSKGGAQYDVVFETVGKSSFDKCLQSLRPKGHLLIASAGLGQLLQVFLSSLFSGKKVTGGVAKETAEDMDYLKTLIEAGQLKAVIDQSYPLAEAALAHRYVDGGHKKGNVVLFNQF